MISFSFLKKNDQQAMKSKQLEPAFEVVAKLVEKSVCEEMKETVNLLKKVASNLDKYFEFVGKALEDTKQALLANGLVAS